MKNLAIAEIGQLSALSQKPFTPAATTSIKYSIVPATIVHVHKLSASMRDADANEAKALGSDPR